MDQNGYRQWARPSLRVFILKELNAAVCEGLARESNPPYNGHMVGTDCYSQCIFTLRDTDIANGQASELRTTDSLPYAIFYLTYTLRT